jgi:hypothetical protein
MIAELVDLEVEETKDGYLFTLVGSEDHGRASFRLWINGVFRDRIREEGMPLGYRVKFIPSPVENAKVVITEKGNKVLRPQEGWTTVLVLVPSGYRGRSKLKLESLPEGGIILPFYRYASERGSLGISMGLLISAPSKAFPLKLSWERTGRTYGEPKEGTFLLTREGKVIEQPPEDVKELLHGPETDNIQNTLKL